MKADTRSELRITIKCVIFAVSIDYVCSLGAVLRRVGVPSLYLHAVDLWRFECVYNEFFRFVLVVRFG